MVVVVVGALLVGVLVVWCARRWCAVVGVLAVFPLGSDRDGDGDAEPGPPETSPPSPGTELLVVVAGGVVVVLVGAEPLSSACWTKANLGAVGCCGVRKANRASSPTATASDTSSEFLSQRLEATPRASAAALALTIRSTLIAAASFPLGRASFGGRRCRAPWPSGVPVRPRQE